MNEKDTLNMKFSLKMLYPVQTSRGRCTSDNISRDNENLLPVATFHTPISSFWARPYSDEGNKHVVVLVT